MKKRVTTTKAKKEAWKWFSRFIRMRGSVDGYNKCVTCGRAYPVTGKGCIQAGHFVPGRKNGVLYDERGVWPQCYGCNCMQKGAWVEYESFMKKTFPLGVIEDIKYSKHKTVHMSPMEHMEIAEKYRRKCVELGGWPGEA